MFRNYLKITLRNLFRQRVLAGINLLGLAFGLTCTIIIALWIRHELSINQFHDKKGEIYRVLEHQTYDEGIYTFAATPGPLAEKLRNDFPEILHASRVSWGDKRLLTYGNESFNEMGYSVDPDFLEIFSFPLISGNKETALLQPNNILISQALADKLFPRENPMDKSILLDNETEYRVTGILEKVPSNSSLRFDFLIPVENYVKRNSWLKNWDSNGIRTFFVTQPGITPSHINEKIKNVVAENGQENVELLAQHISDWYLRSDFKDGKLQGGRIDSVRMFGIIAIFILLIACINFMNLSTAKSANRALEVGVRKVSGATRGHLAVQFLSESVIIAFLAGIIGVALASMTLPYFNRLFDIELSMESAGATFWYIMVQAVLLTGLISGSYPAFFLSGYKPVSVLKGSTPVEAVRGKGGGVQLRKVLVTIQFVISVFLIVSTLVVYRQMELIKDKDLGYDKENLVYFPVNGTLWDKYETVKNDLLQIPAVSSVSYTNGHFHAWGNNTSDYNWQGKNPEESILFQTIPVGYDFLQTAGIQLLNGRDFSPQFPADTLNFIINETAAKLMGMDDPLGQTLSLHDVPGTIIGIARDFHVGTFRSKQDPVVLMLRDYKNFIYTRIAPGDISETLSAIENVFKKHNPAFPFEYFFTDQEYAELHRNEARTGELAKVFAFLAIFVSCLGLFGLAAFATEQRRKEIGIRKVLGASVPNLTLLVTRDFLKLVLLAMLIAIPFAWWAMDRWLQDFTFRVDLDWWLFALAGGVAVAVASLTVGFQSIKAALANPIRSLRSE